MLGCKYSKLNFHRSKAKLESSDPTAYYLNPTEDLWYLDGVVKAENVVMDSSNKSGLDLVKPCRVANIIGPNFELGLDSKLSRFSRLDEADFIDLRLLRLPVLLPPKWKPHFRRTPLGFVLGVLGEASEVY